MSNRAGGPVLFSDIDHNFQPFLFQFKPSGTWGAAFSAGIGAGLYHGFQELTPHIQVVFEPNFQNHALFQLRYETYKVLAATIPEAVRIPE